MEGHRKTWRFGIVWMMRFSISDSEQSLKAHHSHAQQDPCSAVATGKVYSLKAHSLESQTFTFWHKVWFILYLIPSKIRQIRKEGAI